jgi:GLPGLI family protein
MKKKVILHLNMLLFFAMVFSAKAQTGRIIYQVFSSHQMENLSEDIYQYFDLVNISIENNPMDFELTFNRGEAFFEIKDRMGTNDFQAKIAKVMLGGTKKFYYNLETEEFLKQEVAYGETFLIPIDKPIWELSKSSKMIGKYKCYKATTHYSIENDAGSFKKDVIAWYCPEIPYMYGPSGFFGLPGLILELTDDSRTYSATEISLNQSDYNIVKPNTGVIITQEEFGKLREKFKR